MNCLADRLVVNASHAFLAIDVFVRYARYNILFILRRELVPMCISSSTPPKILEGTISRCPLLSLRS